MMREGNRRRFLRTCATAGLAVQMPGWLPTGAAAASKPAMSITRYGNPTEEPDGIAEEAERLTRAAVDALGGMSRFVAKGEVVWVKPNICFARTPEQAVNTNPHVVATLVTMCFESGAKEVRVGNNHSRGQTKSYARSGIPKEVEKAGGRIYHMDECPLKTMALNGKSVKEWEVYPDMVEVDKLINVPIVKHHVYAKVTLGIKNFMGAIGGERRPFHSDFANMLPDLAAFFNPDLIVLDAIRILTRNGPVGGNLADVERKDTLAAGTDQVAIDAYGASLLGHKPSDIDYIKEAASRGMGTLDFAALAPTEVTV